MKAFETFTAPLASLPVDNIDTDQIIPARFLTTTSRAGLGQQCFNDWRYDSTGQPRGDFALGPVVAAGHSILLAGRNFGCGSSREHAPWALLDFGIRVVISTQIADIFRSNALKNGLLPIVVSEDDVVRLDAQVGQPLTVDLSAGELRLADGSRIGFHTEAFARTCLLRGVDQLGYVLDAENEIAAYEAARPRSRQIA